MAEIPSFNQPQEARRAGLNPLSDYGRPESRSHADKVIEEINAQMRGETLNTTEQMSFLLDGTVKLDPAAIPYKRSVVGSATFTKEQMATPGNQQNESHPEYGRDDGSGRSSAARNSIADGDRAASRAKSAADRANNYGLPKGR